jgi:hypothetical protein
MSDAVMVALIVLAGTVLTQIGTWISGRRDRALASKTVVTLTKEIEELERKHQVEMEGIRKQHATDLNACYLKISQLSLRLAELGVSP